MSKIFVSYRREDSGPVARRLAESFARTFGSEQVFIDTDTIKLSDRWKEKIDEALHESLLIVVLIGPRWLFLQDANGRRRIDNEDDWVRNEILFGLKAGKKLIPVQVSGAALPKEEALPVSLRPLLESQAYELGEKYWDRDIKYFTDSLQEQGIVQSLRGSAADDVPFPVPIDTSKPLSESELKDALASLPGWEISHRAAPGRPDRQTIELYRLFKFGSFEDAIHFMSTASRFIAATNHHPEWINLWVSIRVWLTTWDIGHQPTFKDVRLAEYLERLYREYMVS
jgi:pterin-4a-carbinolamine dehydratase